MKGEQGPVGTPWQSPRSLCVNTVNTLFLWKKEENQHLLRVCQGLVTGLVTFISMTDL